MDADARYALNAPQVVDEIIDGEVMIIHLGTGHYYNLQHTGAKVWQLLRAGHTQAEIIGGVVRLFTGESSAISPSVVQFLDRLQQEGLIRPWDISDTPGAVMEDGAGAERPAFQPPELSKYLDMQQLLALDPIHQTDEQGWPRTQKETT